MNFFPEKMDRKQLADILEEIGYLLELKGENPFKARAYYKAARLFREEDIDPQELVESGGLSSLPGIGDALAKKITELVRTGKLTYYKKLKASISDGLIKIMKIPGMGPRRANSVYRKLGIEGTQDLLHACRSGQLAVVRGFNKELIRSISDFLEKMDK